MKKIQNLVAINIFLVYNVYIIKLIKKYNEKESKFKFDLQRVGSGGSLYDT